MTRQRHRVIFWDFDGTLGHRPEAWSGTLAAVCAERYPEASLTREDIHPFIRAGFPWHVPETPHPELHDPDLWWARLTEVFARAFETNRVPPDVARELALAVRARYVDPAGFVLFEDSLPTLEHLSKLGWRHVLVTNHVPELPAILEALGLASRLIAVVNSASVGYEKPHAEIFRIALEVAGRPDCVWMVGDNVVADVLGAEDVGIPGILVRKEDARARRRCEDLRAVADVVVGSLG